MGISNLSPVLAAHGYKPRISSLTKTKHGLIAIDGAQFLHRNLSTAHSRYVEGLTDARVVRNELNRDIIIREMMRRALEDITTIFSSGAAPVFVIDGKPIEQKAVTKQKRERQYSLNAERESALRVELSSIDFDELAREVSRKEMESIIQLQRRAFEAQNSASREAQDNISREAQAIDGSRVQISKSPFITPSNKTPSPSAELEPDMDNVMFMDMPASSQDFGSGFGGFGNFGNSGADTNLTKQVGGTCTNDLGTSSNELSTSQKLQKLRMYTARNCPRLTSREIEMFTNLLRALGVAVIVAPDEGERMCSLLARHGLVDYVMSTDSDTLAFGAPRIIRSFDRSGAQSANIELVEMKDVLRALDMTQDEFIDLCILLGNDFNTHIPTVGHKRSLEIHKEIGRNLDNPLPPKYQNARDALNIDWCRAFYKDGNIDKQITRESLVPRAACLSDDSLWENVHRDFHFVRNTGLLKSLKISAAPI
jgi:5'-3' exonuclease